MIPDFRIFAIVCFSIFWHGCLAIPISSAVLCRVLNSPFSHPYRNIKVVFSCSVNRQLPIICSIASFRSMFLHSCIVIIIPVQSYETDCLFITFILHYFHLQGQSPRILTNLSIPLSHISSTEILHILNPVLHLFIIKKGLMNNSFSLKKELNHQSFMVLL